MLTQVEFIAYVNERYPTVKISELSDFSKEYKPGDGMWLRGEDSGEPFPLFTGSFAMRNGFEGGISVVFTDWAWKIGWFVECYDYGSYFVTPRATAEAYFEKTRLDFSKLPCSTFADECPF